MAAETSPRLEPWSKAILLQNYGANLTFLLGMIAGLSLIAYAVRVARDRSMPSSDPPATRAP